MSKNLLINSIDIVKREKIANNSTFDSVVDKNIKAVTLWRVNKKKHICALIIYTISFGIIYLCTLIWPTLFIHFSCIESDLENSEYAVIEDNDDQKHVEVLIKINLKLKFEKLNQIYKEGFQEKILDIKSESDSKNENDSKNDSGSFRKKSENKKASDSLIEEEEVKNEDDITDNINHINKLEEAKCFKFFNNYYAYNFITKNFVPLTLYLNEYTRKEIYDLRCGIPTQDILEGLGSLYPKNIIRMRNQGVLMVFFTEAINPYYIYIYISIFICLYAEYWHFSIVIAICIAFLLIVSTNRKYQNLKRILNFEQEKEVKVCRENAITIIKTEEIVPGDAIILERLNPSDKNKIPVPCDGVILEGYCTVNESDLTGESTLVLRREIERDSELLNYKRDKNSFLFQGTLISSLFSPKAKKNQITILAMNTGYNTYRGNMIQNWENQKPRHTERILDSIVVIGVLFVMYILSIVLVFLFCTDYDISEKIQTIVDNITVVFPPAICICIGFGRFYFNYKLKEKSISCVIEEKIDSAGLVDIIVLDKTGTLTESHLGIYCYKTTTMDEDDRLFFDEQELTPSILNKIYKKFWQQIYKNKLSSLIEGTDFDTSYQIKSKFNLLYFTECLATCHNIYRINHENFGNSLDQKLFSEINWDIIQDNDEINSEIRVQPHNAYKITENTIYGHNNNINQLESNYYLHYLQRYEFKSQFQSMTVVVENSIDKTIRVYTKGAPEKIKKICFPETFPLDLDDQLKKYTGEGFRVLACATKKIEKFDKNNTTAEDLEDSMTFLGIIVFQNQIKKDTKEHITNLQKSKCKLVIATGDNVFTTVSVAQQCGILQLNSNIYHVEPAEKNDTSLMITHSYYKKKHLTEKDSESHSKNSDISVFENTDDIIKESDSKEEFISMIKKILNDPLSDVCCSGSALSIILQRNKEQKTDCVEFLSNLIAEKGKIFYRMLPDNKSSLVKFFQERDESIVAMCGDGANDCNAFMTSNIGVAINQTTGNNLISHFYSKKDSIDCLEDIIKNGRACLENKLMLIKFMILYSFIQIATVMFLSKKLMELNYPQYIYMDVFCVLIPSLIAGKTTSKIILSDTKPPKNISNKYFIISSIGQIVIHIAGFLLFSNFIDDETLELSIDENPRDDMNVLSTYVYLFSVFQYIIVLFVFNSQSIHRKSFYSNKFYLIYFSALFLFSVMLISIKEMPQMILGVTLVLFEEDSKNFEERLERNKAITFCSIFGLFIVSYLYEVFSFYISKIKI